jgi:hypothetical protein
LDLLVCVSRVAYLTHILDGLLVNELSWLTSKFMAVNIDIRLHIFVSDFVELLLIKSNVNAIEFLLCANCRWLRRKSVGCLALSSINVGL